MGRRSRQRFKPKSVFGLPKGIGPKEKRKMEKPAIHISGLLKRWPPKYEPLRAKIQTAVGEANQLHREAMEAHSLMVGPVKLRFKDLPGQKFPKPELAVNPKGISRKEALRKAGELSKIIAKLQRLAGFVQENAIKAETGIKEMNPKDCPEEAIRTAHFALGRIAEISIEARGIFQQLVDAQHLLEVYSQTGQTSLPLKPDYR